jgi:hypothetical protein
VGLISIILLSFVESERESEKRKFERRDGSERHYAGSGGEKNNIFGLDGSQAVPGSPSDRDKAYDQN